MLVSKLIDQLLKAQDTYGDFEVRVHDASDANDIQEVSDALDFEFRLLKEKNYDELPGIRFDQDKDNESMSVNDTKYFGIIFRDY